MNPVETGSSWLNRLKNNIVSFNVAEFIRRRPYLRRRMPGIKLKLSILFGLFISLILASATLFNYINQSRILEESFHNEIESSLKHINSAALSMDSIRTNILLVEEMKIRIAEKQEDLKKYKNYVYRKKDSISNTLKSLGKKLGMKVSYDYYRKGYDTYYSMYLSEKEISGIEKNIAEQLKHKNGSGITPAEMKAVQERGKAVAYYQHRIDTIEKEIDLNKSGSAKAVKLLNSRLKREKYRKRIAEIKFRKILKNFYEYNFRTSGTAAMENSSIRIITSGINGDINFDTGNLIRDGIVKFSPLLEDKKFIMDRNTFFTSPGRMQTGDKTSEHDYGIRESYYHVKFLPIFKNPATYERLVLIGNELEKNGKEWIPYLKEDIRISGLLAGQSLKIKERLAFLRENKTVPGKDSIFRSLYDEYSRLLAERDACFSKLSPYTDEIKRLNDYYKKQINTTSSEISRLEKRLSELKGIKTPDNEDDIKNKIESIQAVIDDNREEIKKLKYEMENVKEDIWQSEKLSANDAMRLIRDAALFDFAILRQKNNPMAYRNYLRSSDIRRADSARYDMFRRWIMDAGSETGLPESITGIKNTNLADDGILAYSRSEVEEYMWLLDSTPVAGNTGLFSVETDGGLIADLKENSITGFNIVLVDKTDGVNKIAANRDRMILYSSIIALFSIVLTYFLAGFMVRRIKSIIAQTSLAGQGDFSVVFPEKGLDEIEDLGVSLNTMIKGLREKEELKGEIAAAGEIQKILLPEKIPSTLEGYYSIGTFYRSMQGVGGDYYDIIELDENRIFFCIGDVSNHGVGPAIVMSMLRAHLHGIIKRGSHNLINILCELNQQIYQETPPHIFVTLFTGVIDRTSNEIEYCSAGHLKPAVYRYKKENIEILSGGGLPVGMDDNDFFKETISINHTKIAPGDIFFQYTDGASEAMDSSRQLFGEERIFDELKLYARKRPEVMINRIVEAIERFTGKKIIDTMVSELNDDIAMIVFKRIR